MAKVNYFLVTKKFTYISFYFINKLLQEEMAGNGMPQIEDSNDANKQKESVKKGAVTELRLLRAYSKNQRFIRSTAQIMQLMRGTAFDKKAVSMYQNQKIPDKVSRRSTALVRHFIQDTIVTFSKSLLA